MTLREFGLLTDENVHPEVVRFLREQGFDVLDVKEERLQGTTDQQLLRLAREQDRVVLTHDSDFGGLAISKDEPFVGVVYLRPGHLSPAFTQGTLGTLIDQDRGVTPPFIIVAERVGHRVKIRLRSL